MVVILCNFSLPVICCTMMSYIIQRMLCKGCYRFHRFSILVWTGKNDSNTLRVWTQFFSKTKKKSSLLKVFGDVKT